jgi:hypothetical protein
MALYFVSGIWFDKTGNTKAITHVFLHITSDSGRKFESGIKTAKNDAIRLIDAANPLQAIRWIYNRASWQRGAMLSTETLNGIRYLRTIGDGIISDNLDNLIDLNGYM